ncbi:hypothetical protein GCM10011316_04080 [Roseibium aquae]|uniref:Endonuclease/exonuclease/phosphatase domain-containing protein n=1 Tax=Roseibium aquae TaxID=1323746 RepID=A0A916T979_9HYPH|nr:endonuclease/exonuclease/phosphatase family protein [Roseibium aquae]GGB35132.1 hypothetical protein GCM10011316_04080 [Roseibium aquae]
MKQLISLAGWGILAASLGFCLLGLSAFAFAGVWLSDNMSFFVPQLLGFAAAGLIAGTILCWFPVMWPRFFKAGLLLLCAGLAVLAAATMIRPLGLVQNAATSDAPAIRMVSINLERLFLHAPRLTAYLSNLQADILVFQETAWGLQEWRLARSGPGQAFAGTAPYPGHLAVGDLGGIVLFSRYPIRHREFISVPGTPPDNPGARRGILAVTLDTDQGPLQVLAVHAASPRDRTRWMDRQAYLETLRRVISQKRRDSEAPLVVMGDWNTSPWSYHFGQTLSQTGLNTRFPSGFPIATRFFFDYRLRWILGAPVDHIAVSPGVDLSNVSVGPDVGTDHRPLIADLTLPRTR